MIMFFTNGLESPKVFFDNDGSQGGGSEKKESANNHDEHLQQAIKERDEAKNKSRDLEKELATMKGKLQEIDDAKKINNGKAQELATERQAKIDEMQKEIDRLKVVETTHNNYIESRKKSLLEVIPEADRPQWQNSDLETLEKVAKLYSGKNEVLGMDGGRGGKVIVNANTKFDDLTSVELEQLKKDNPTEYDRIFKAKFGQKSEMRI